MGPLDRLATTYELMAGKILFFSLYVLPNRNFKPLRVVWSSRIYGEAWSGVGGAEGDGLRRCNNDKDRARGSTEMVW